MRTIGACLCLVFIIPFRGSVPTIGPFARTAFLAGTTERSRARATLLEYLESSRVMFRPGKFAEAAEMAWDGYNRAKRQGEPDVAAHFLWRVGNCHFAEHRYSEALKLYLEALAAFEGLHDPRSVSALNGNLSSLYSELGDYDSAIDAAKRGMVEVPGDRNGRHARLQIVLASLEAKRGRMAEAIGLFHQGIWEADQIGDSELCADAWNTLGYEFLIRKELSQAEGPLLESYRLRKLLRLRGIENSYRNLGILRLEQGDLPAAELLLEEAVGHAKTHGALVPEWRFYHSRGRIRLAQGQAHQAYADFRIALNLVRNDRRAVPANDGARTGHESLMQELYSAFVEAGNRLYLSNGHRELLEETFEAVEENRAASLVAYRAEETGRRRNLPLRYWELHARLQSTQSELIGEGAETALRDMGQLRASLAELEAKAGIHPHDATGLFERTRGALDDNTLILSFHLAEPESWVWALSSEGVALIRLPGKTSISHDVESFRQSVQAGSASTGPLGRQLYGRLFGKLRKFQTSKPKWLLSLDERLFELPFAALVVAGSANAPVYLMERHSVRIISGAAMWTSKIPPQPEKRLSGSFLGVGDAVYNTADSRWHPRLAGPAPWISGKPITRAPALSRLVGSGREIELCAAAWKNNSVLLRGMDVTKGGLKSAIAANPSIVHLATHMVPGPPVDWSAGGRGNGPGSAMIALSAGAGGENVLLGPAEISGWPMEHGIVVLSGCGSGVAVARPGSGLMGMTRAWLMAGAEAVVASRWPTPDDSGIFFLRFYRSLRESSLRDPAEALRVAQIDMLSSRNWRSQPKYWAAYFVLGSY